MSPFYVIFQSAYNGPGGKPHRVIAGEVDKDFVAGEGQTLIEAKDLSEAKRKMGSCPACEEGLNIIKKWGFPERR